MARTDISTDQNKTKSNIKNLSEGLEQKANEVKQDLSAKAREAGMSVRQWFDGKKDQIEDVRKKTEGRIKENPFTSTAIAFAAGVVISALLRRR